MYVDIGSLYLIEMPLLLLSKLRFPFFIKPGYFEKSGIKFQCSAGDMETTFGLSYRKFAKSRVRKILCISVSARLNVLGNLLTLVIAVCLQITHHRQFDFFAASGARAGSLSFD